MRRLTIIILTLLVLATVILLFLLKGNDPFGSKNSNFSIEWVDQVRYISITKDSDKTVLSKTGNNEWTVNGDKTARQSAVNFLMFTLERMTIKSPVSDSMLSQLLDDKPKPIKVEVRARGGLSSSFLVYHTGDSVFPSILRRSRGTKSYTVQLPGYKGDPGTYFVADEQYWLPFDLFSADPADVESISVFFADPSMDDYRIEARGDSLSLFVNDEYVPSDSERTSRYFTYFSYVPFEKHAIGLSKDMKDSILDNKPVIIFNLKYKGGDTRTVSLRTRYINEEGIYKPDTDRLYASINNGADLLLVRYFDIDPLIKSSEYFITH